ncbi:MAG: lipopolysaccharide kinase InaA family protein [Planctomycetota bacterium]|nr:lipopolysaccharide kinase InaA family protein [Planctomycetota bacterium]
MDVADTIPALLKPLAGECVIVDGDSGAEAAMAAIREALQQPDGFRTQRVRPGRAIYEFKTREGEFIVKAFETRFMTRMSPLRFCPSGREWKSIRQAQSRGIPTARPVGLYSARSKPGGNYLVLERIAGAAEFEAYLERERERLRNDVGLLRGWCAASPSSLPDCTKAGCCIMTCTCATSWFARPGPANPLSFL